MLNATPHTFIDIFEANPTENDDIFIKGIDIPIIQRDYAQGRSDLKAESVRHNLLKDIFTKDKTISFDFIFGTFSK